MTSPERDQREAFKAFRQWLDDYNDRIGVAGPWEAWQAATAASAARIAELERENKLQWENVQQLLAENERLQSDLAAARAQLAESQKDAERLSWLDRDDIMLDPGVGPDGESCVWIRLARTLEVIAQGKTIRETIDRAMR